MEKIETPETTPKKKAPAKKKPAKKTEIRGDDANVTTKTKAALRAQKTVKVKIQSTEKDKLPVFIAVNGHNYRIKRDEWVDVPEAILEVLENAVMKKLRQTEKEDGSGMENEIVDVQRFSFSTKR